MHAAVLEVGNLQRARSRRAGPQGSFGCRTARQHSKVPPAVSCPAGLPSPAACPLAQSQAPSHAYAQCPATCGPHLHTQWEGRALMSCPVEPRPLRLACQLRHEVSECKLKVQLSWPHLHGAPAQFWHSEEGVTTMALRTEGRPCTGPAPAGRSTVGQVGRRASGWACGHAGVRADIHGARQICCPH